MKRDLIFSTADSVMQYCQYKALYGDNIKWENYQI
jgi:hypothetical protein